jgi:hypothetical protein
MVVIWLTCNYNPPTTYYKLHKYNHPLVNAKHWLGPKLEKKNSSHNNYSIINPKDVKSPTPTFVNKIRSNKTTSHISTRSTWVKRNNSSTHNAMVEMTKKGNNLLVDSIDHIHASSLLMEDNYTRTQELLF